MIDKEEGRIPCAHCSNARATCACPHCGRMVCGACDDGTLGACPFPRPRTLALPAGCRAVDADPEGERLLYEKPGGGWGHLDLTTAGEAAAAVSKAPPPRSELPLICALDRGRVAWVERKRHYFNMLHKLEVHVHEPWGINGHYRRALASNHDFWLFGQGGDVVVLWAHKAEVLKGGSSSGKGTYQLPRYMTTGSIHGGVLALGAGRLVMFYNVTSEEGSLLLPAEVLWLRLTAAALVLIVRAGEGRAMALAVPYEGGPAPWRERPPRKRRPRAPTEAAVTAVPRYQVPCSVSAPTQASASHDGCLVVLATPEAGQVVALDLVTGAQQLVTASAAPIDLVKLVDDDRQLVTASTVGEVGVWHVRKRRIVLPP